jgi:hypothetical protein
MNWQVNYALKNINKDINKLFKAEHIEGDVIKVTTIGQPDVLAHISPCHEITLAIVKSYIEQFPKIDFVCGYRNNCIWKGDAIDHLQTRGIGWGNSGTLLSAVRKGDANIAEHKTWVFSSRLIHKYGIVKSATREFDRIFMVELKSGHKLRIGMIADYEPTADSVRTLVDQFGRVDIAWNINPNGQPTASSLQAGKELGCEVLKTDCLKAHLQSY